MSSCLDVSSEQLCYIPCNFCSIVLAVSVPCSSLLDIVTVRCGHCGNLWSVNMAAAAFHSHNSSAWQPLQQAASYGNSSPMSSTGSSTARFLNNNYNYNYNYNYNNNNNNNNNKIVRPTPMPPPPMPHPPVTTIPTTNIIHEERVVNRPPEKRQRVPSAYNQFIKEEIQRIKASNPDISHREAFSTAAKNWAHFPHIHFGLMLENNNNQAKVLNEARSTALLNN